MRSAWHLPLSSQAHGLALAVGLSGLTKVPLAFLLPTWSHANCLGSCGQECCPVSTLAFGNNPQEVSEV